MEKHFTEIAKLNSQLARRGVDLRALKSTARAMTAGRDGASLEDLRAARSELRALLRQLERQQKESERKIGAARQRIFSAAFLALFGGAALDRALEEEPQSEDFIASAAEETISDEAPAVDEAPVVSAPVESTPPPPIASVRPLPAYPEFRESAAPPSPRNYFALTPAELSRLQNYAGSFRIEEHTDQQISRTFAGRLDDHIILLRDISARPSRSEAKQLTRPKGATLDFFNGNGRPFFIDIGPGVANSQSPAVTSVEMARAFPNMSVVALDLPEEVEKFETQIPQRKKDALARVRNLSIVSGDGLKSLRDQIPALPNGAPLIIRTANAIDIYCEWEDVEPALIRMAEDFKDHPVFLFFNREILWKPQGKMVWENIGQVSDRGFRHSNRDLRRNGAPPYYLKPEYDFFRPKPRMPPTREMPIIGEFPAETPEFLRPAVARLERFGLQPNQYGLVVDIPSR